jgi:ribosome-associated translation inhibitor RaiA
MKEGGIMRLEIVTKGFQSTEATTDFLESSARQLIETFLDQEKDSRFRVIVDEDRHRMQNRKPHFTCQLVVKTDSSRKIFKAHSSGDEFHKTVHEAFLVMKRILAKRAQRFRPHDQSYQASA